MRKHCDEVDRYHGWPTHSIDATAAAFRSPCCAPVLKVPGTGTAGSETSLASWSLSGRNRSGVSRLIRETKKTKKGLSPPLSGAKPDLKCPFRSVAQISSFSRSVGLREGSWIFFFFSLCLHGCFDRQTVSSRVNVVTLSR